MIAKGTTARQLGSLARWMLACLVVVAMMAWPRPSMISWGALVTGMMATLLLWLMWRIVAGDTTVPGHPVQWVLLVPAAILAYHLSRQSLLGCPDSASDVKGALNVSMLFQLGLLAVGVMLSQSLLPRAAQHTGVLSVCGAAMMLAPVGAGITDGLAVEAMRDSLAMLGFAGVGVWLSSLWGVGWRVELWPDEQRMGRPGSSLPIHAQSLRVVITVIAVAAAAALTWLSPRSAILCACILGGVLLLGGLVFPHRRGLLLIAGGVLSAGALATAVVTLPLAGLSAHVGQAGPLGLGEAAFGRIGASSSGLAVLAWTIGWGGLCWMAGGLLVCVVWLMSHARRRRAWDRRRAIVWTWTTAVSSCAMLSVGGMFTPAMVMAAAFTWGLMPQMLGRPNKARWGGVVLIVMVALAIVVGIAKDRGLISWAADATMRSPRADKWMHMGVGALLTLTLAWLLGAKRIWLGLVGIVLAAAAGGVGELMQWGFQRTMDVRDWYAHLFGCLAAVGPYLLCMGARWCESADVRQRGADGTDRYMQS